MAQVSGLYCFETSEEIILFSFSEKPINSIKSITHQEMILFSNNFRSASIIQINILIVLRDMKNLT